MSARRAVRRWGLRLVRTEWREQLLVISLITMGVALSLLFSLFVFHSEPPELNGGTYNFDGEPAQVDRLVGALGDDISPFELGNTTFDGGLGTVVTKAIDGEQPLHDPWIDLIEGSLPSGPTEVALTDGVRDLVLADIGDTVTLDGATLSVAGIVENPIQLDDEFALLDHRDPAPVEMVTVYRTSLSIEEVEGTAGSIGFMGGIGGNSNQSPPVSIMTNIVTFFAMLLIGLVASASFGVVARRRVRQYGLLGALGAEPRLLKRAAAANGFAVGVLATIIGGAIGCLGAWAFLPLLETALGNRINFSLPLSILIPTALIAIVVSTLAAWWPARAVATQPVVEALAARRPKSQPVRNTTALGLALGVAGFILMFWASREQAVLPAFGAIALSVVGVLLLSPAIISAIGRLVAGAPLPVRIAGRDLARFQGRAAAALGAIVLALAIPVGIGVATASNDARKDGNPNLPTDTAIVWAPSIEDPGSDTISIDARAAGSDGAGMLSAFGAESAEAVLERVSAALPELTAAPIRIYTDTANEPWVNDEGVPLRSSVAAGVPFDCSDTEPNGSISNFDDAKGNEVCTQNRSVWAADPELLDLWGLSADAGDELLIRGGEPVYIEVQRSGPDVNPNQLRTDVRAAAIPDYSSFSGVLAPEGAIGTGLSPTTVGWILAADAPLTSDQIATLRSEVGGGARVETQSSSSGGANVRLIAAVAGMLVGLAILGATVALILGESADQARTLQVMGARGRVRRGVAGATAGLLAAGGALLAAPLGYLVWVIMRADKSIEAPFAVPWLTFAILFVVFPLLAAAVTAAMVGGSGRRIARRPGQ